MSIIYLYLTDGTMDTTIDISLLNNKELVDLFEALTWEFAYSVGIDTVPIEIDNDITHLSNKVRYEILRRLE